MPDDNNFSRDISSVDGSNPSELYKSVAPMVDGAEFHGLKGYDREKIDRLKEQLQKGMVGLEYLTGLKKNKAETFYDAHPVQAVATDAAKYAPIAGLGLSAAMLAKDHLTVRSQRKKDQAAIPSISDDPKGGGRKAYDAEIGGEDRQAKRFFGSGYGDPSTEDAAIRRRIEHLDTLTSKSDPSAPKISDKYNAASAVTKEHQGAIDGLKRLEQEASAAGHGFDSKTHKLKVDLATGRRTAAEEARIKAIKSVMSDMNDLPAARTIEKMQGMHKVLRTNGGLDKGKLLGEDLQLSTWLPEWFKKYFLPGYRTSRLAGMASGALLETDSKNFDKHTSRNMLADVGGLDPKNTNLASVEGRKLEALDRGVIDPLSRSAERGGLSTGSRVLNRLKFPVAMGAGVAAGGIGLHHLLKALQSQMYGKDQMNEWKRNLLKSRSQFEEAEKVQ